MEFIIKQEELNLVVDTEMVNCDGESDVKVEASTVTVEAEDPLKGRFIFVSLKEGGFVFQYLVFFL